MRSLLLALAFVLASCLPARAAVVFDANATASCTANAVTAINCSNLTVGTGTNRALVCVIVWSGLVSTPALTWDNGATNQAMTAITNATAANGTSVSVQMYGRVAPTSGAKQLRATWTTARDVYVNCTSWTSVNQTGGTTTFPHGIGGTGTGTTGQGVTVTIAAGNATMGVFGTASAVTISSVNNTQTFLNNAAANIDGAGNRAAGATTVAMTATYSGSAVWAAAGCDILAAPCAPSLTLLGVGRCN